MGLLIKGKRADGYHLLETVLFPVFHLHDELWIERCDQPGCTLLLDGIPLEGEPNQNLCCKAYVALSERVGGLPGVKMRLKKNIPAGAGLGGGSSDAAFALKGLNTLFGLGLDQAGLAQLGESLGADVPFFLFDKPLLATGIGTEFEEVNLSIPYELRLFTPDIHSSTADVYRALDYRTVDPGRSLKQLLALPVESWKDHLVNDLETVVFKQHPELANIKQQLYDQGAVYAAMSGSGSAMFGWF